MYNSGQLLYSEVQGFCCVFFLFSQKRLELTCFGYLPETAGLFYYMLIQPWQGLTLP